MTNKTARNTRNRINKFCFAGKLLWKCGDLCARLCISCLVSPVRLLASSYLFIFIHTVGCSFVRSFVVRTMCIEHRVSHYSYYIVENIFTFSVFCHFRMSAYKFNLENCCYELSINDVIALEENKIEAREKAKKDDQKQAVKAGEPHMCTVHLHE